MMIIYKAGLSEAYEEDSYLEYFVNEEDAKKKIFIEFRLWNVQNSICGACKFIF